MEEDFDKFDITSEEKGKLTWDSFILTLQL